MASADVTVARPSTTKLPRKKIRWGEQLVHAVLFIAAAISVLTTLGIVLSLLLPALEFFREVRRTSGSCPSSSARW
jgi:ABC-type phosphate transport system permease subunit